MYSCDIFKSYFYNYSFLNVVELHQDFFLNYVIKIIIKILPTIILTKGVVFYWNRVAMVKIVKGYCEGRKFPYQLFWIEDGVRHSRFFETEVVCDDFLRLNRHLDKRSFEALLGIDENTISDISCIV